MARSTVQDYLTRSVVWGGEITTRVSVIAELRADGLNSRQIDQVVGYQCKDT